MSSCSEFFITFKQRSTRHLVLCDSVEISKSCVNIFRCQHRHRQINWQSLQEGEDIMHFFSQRHGEKLNSATVLQCLLRHGRGDKVKLQGQADYCHTNTTCQIGPASCEVTQRNMRKQDTGRSRLVKDRSRIVWSGFLECPTLEPKVRHT